MFIFGRVFCEFFLGKKVFLKLTSLYQVILKQFDYSQQFDNNTNKNQKEFQDVVHYDRYQNNSKSFTFSTKSICGQYV